VPRYHDISIPLRFDEWQPVAFGAPQASVGPLRLSGWIGDTREGGSCNVDQVSLVPHCNGTHTECVGHIVDDDVRITDILTDILIPARLITLVPAPGSTLRETYRPAPRPDDLLITRSLLEEALQEMLEPDAGLVIRTLPNEASKLRRDYAGQAAPYFTIEAIDRIIEWGVRHLLVDFPSLDRTDDEGLLTAHHRFWGIPEGMHKLGGRPPSHRTVTELIYMPDEVPDGRYLLNLQIAPFARDAAPSRPLLMPISELAALSASLRESGAAE